ncbi:MAG TPA: tRNA (adenosine(37)-N6)-threonylcarbamoyltransferase complex transferase subunit TsaD [Acidobacteriota bacterium]|nr:tRNA (adenosine(37)-N6)-threonylcarbamoyltransferase complex transferase subunit TsaD [Acidobacteriota bacterium]
MIVLGIETSCDETSAAVLDDNRILSNVISSQIKVHEKYGGVVPELASRHHLDNIGPVLQEAIDRSNLKLSDVEGIGATYGPGLVGSLLVGLNVAKSLAISIDVPFVGVNHLEAHLHSIFLEHPETEVPMLCVIASGGHTSLYLMRTHNDYELLGQTRDDAIGEAFDKVAKLLGLGYPGGPVIDRIAEKKEENVLGLTHAQFGSETYDFSYSGIKTAILYHVHRNNIPAYSGGEYSSHVVDICRSFQTVAIEMLMNPLKRAAAKFKPKSISFSGGVACNSYLREVAGEWGRSQNLPVYFPSLILSTDNAAMIAFVAQRKLMNGLRDSLSLNAEPNLKY